VINVISKYIIAVVVRLRPTLILFVHGPCGSSLLRSNLKYFLVDCLIFRRCLAFVYPDFSVQISCYTALHSTFYDYLVYGTCWTAGLRCSVVVCGFPGSLGVVCGAVCVSVSEQNSLMLTSNVATSSISRYENEVPTPNLRLSFTL